MTTILLTACGAAEEDGSMLYGEWRWEDGPHRLTFEEDGTGGWTGVLGPFNWEIRRGQIQLSNNANHRSTWNFNVERDLLHIECIDNSELCSWTYVRIVEEEPISDEETITLSEEDFIGAWIETGGWMYVFADDGTGIAGTGDDFDNFDEISWEIRNGNQIYLKYLEFSDELMLYATIVHMDGNRFTLVYGDDREFIFIKIN